MNFNQLKYIVAVEKYRNFAHTADENLFPLHGIEFR